MSLNLKSLQVPQATVRSGSLVNAPIAEVPMSPVQAVAPPAPAPVAKPKASVVTKRVTVSLFDQENEVLGELELRALKSLLKVSTTEVMRTAMHLLASLPEDEFVKAFETIEKTPLS